MESKAFCNPAFYAHQAKHGLLTKTLMVMRLTGIILLTALLQVSAKGKAQTVNYSVQGAPLSRVLAVIEKQTGYNIIYDLDDLRGSGPVTVQLHAASLRDALGQVLAGQALKFEIQGNTIAITRSQPVTNPSPTQFIPPVDLHGRITDSTGKPLAGTTIAVRGSKRVTITDDNGAYSLAGINNNAVLIITHVGYEQREIRLNGQTELNAALKARTTQLEDIQVIYSSGYQNISKEKAVGSFVKLDSASYMSRAGMSIIDRLDGTVTGILFDRAHTSSNPVQIRGITTLGAFSSPLIVVDNFPYTGDLSTINPYDVLSITVLRDAAAASIWGTRAGNGVVVIVTQKGRFNQPFKLSYNSNVTVQEKPDFLYYPQIKSTDYIDLEEKLFGLGYFDAYLSNITRRPVVSPVVELLSRARNGDLTPADAYQQIDAMRNADLRKDLKYDVYKNAVQQQHYINASGGNANFNYFLSAGYDHNITNVKGSRPDDQYTISYTNTLRPVKGLEMEAAINYSNTTTRSYSFILPDLYPYAQLADKQGNHLAIPYLFRAGYIDTAGGGHLLNWQYRPLDEIQNANNKNNLQSIRLNIKATYALTPWLNAEVVYQDLQQTGSNHNDYNMNTFYTRDEINLLSQVSGNSVNYPIPLGDILNTTNSALRSYNFRGSLNIAKRWNGVNAINGFLAQEVSEQNYSNYSNRYYGYNENLGTYSSNINYLTFFPVYGGLNSGYVQIQNGSGLSENNINRVVSTVGNLSYSYKDRYTFLISGRRDGANVFGTATNNKWKPLWSAGGNWDISKESFYNISWMNHLVLRSSYGYSGNVNNQISGLPTVQYNSGLAQYTNLVSAQPGSPPNPNLRWEQVRTINEGVAFGLFKDRITGSFEIYEKRSTDVIASIPVDPSVGVASYNGNAASLKINGFDAELHTVNIKGPVTWATDIGISNARSIVTKANGLSYTTATFTAREINPLTGKMAYGMYAYKWEGLDPTNGDPQGYLSKQVSKDYIDLLYDSVQNQVMKGSAIPLYYGFISNSITWKGFQVSANITYKFDYYFRRPAISYSDMYNWNNLSADYYKRWQQPGDERHTVVPSMDYPADNNRDQFYQFSEVNVKRADNIRLQYVRLNYNVPFTKKHAAPFSSIQVFLYANNLNVFLWKADKEKYDPDITNGYSSYSYPTPRSWATGINVTF